jgi:diguanylate cyclase (GGDEF)-like protein/PAS domain S-box-containing protein
VSQSAAETTAGGSAELRERSRLAAVRTLRLLEDPVGPQVEEIVRLAAEVCGVPNAMLNIFDETHQHSVATVGFEPSSVPHHDSPCWPVLETGVEVIAPDARLDPRIADYPAVDGTLGALRFYATVPVITGNGDIVGTLCAYDLAVHRVSDEQVRMLRALAAQVIGIFQLRNALAQVEQGAKLLTEEIMRAAEVLDTSADAYFAARPDGVVTAWNRASQQLFGYSPDEAIGVNLADLIVPAHLISSFRRLSVEHSVEPTDLRRPVHRKDGSQLLIDLRIWPTRSQPGWHAFAHDVTAIVAAERERDIAQERWRTAFEAAPVGMMVSDLSSPGDPVVVSVNRKYTEILGYTFEQMQKIGIAGVTDPAEADSDREATGRLIAGSLDVLRRDKRYRHAGGHSIWARLTASISRVGETLYLISQVEDITAARAAERARRQAEGLLTIAFDHAPHGTAIIGVQDAERGRLLRVNPALITMTGRRDLIGADLSCLLDRTPDGTRDPVLTAFEQLAEGRLESFEQVCRLQAGGGHIFAEASITLSRDLEGRPEHALAQLRDITQQKAHEEWLTRHAKTDTLTGLANRLAMRERLTEEIDALRTGSGALAVLMLDLDRFKNVNDTLGHEAGDQLLRQVAEALVDCLPTRALAARLGGDEFVVIAPRLDAGAAAELAERITLAVDSVGAQWADRVTECVTGSVGVIATENPATAPEDLVRAADQAMYRVKRERINARIG